jgi:hypothetical protein
MDDEEMMQYTDSNAEGGHSLLLVGGYRNRASRPDSPKENRNSYIKAERHRFRGGRGGEGLALNK